MYRYSRTYGSIPDPQHWIIEYVSSLASLKISKLHIEAFSPPKKETASFWKPEISLFLLCLAMGRNWDV